MPNLNMLQRFVEENLALSITAVVSVLAFRYLYQSTSPPPSQKNIPRTSIIKRWLSLLRNEGHEYLYSKHLKPLVDSAGIAQVRTGPIWIVYLATAERARLFFSRPDVFQKISTSAYLPGSLMDNYFGTNIVVINGEEWKRIQRICLPALRRPLPMNIFADCTREMLAKWKTIDDKPIDVTDWAKRLIMDILGNTIFGYNFNATTMPALDRPWNPIRKRCWESFNQLNQLFFKLIAEKRAVIQQSMAEDDIDKKTMDLLSLMILASEQEDDPLTDQELRDNTCAFFFAGHDTTSTAITAIMYFLGKYPEMQERARDEATKVLGSDLSVHPTAEQQRELVYLNAIIKESLRLVPPVPQVPTRMVTEDIDVGDGIVLPRGTFCTIDIYSIHHSERYWNDAEKFDPERFLDAKKAPLPNTWAPFLGGERSCIAMNMALAEQRVALSMILRAYSWQLPKDSEHQDQLHLRSGEITIPKALPMHFSPLPSLASFTQ
ncbi:cytochrome P450 [Syncephalis fuscata]|nr:cytochrome P450 [Syncephalis fuscata]